MTVLEYLWQNHRDLLTTEIKVVAKPEDRDVPKMTDCIGIFDEQVEEDK